MCRQCHMSKNPYFLLVQESAIFQNKPFSRFGHIVATLDCLVRSSYPQLHGIGNLIQILQGGLQIVLLSWRTFPLTDLHSAEHLCLGFPGSANQCIPSTIQGQHCKVLYKLKFSAYMQSFFLLFLHGPGQRCFKVLRQPTQLTMPYYIFLVLKDGQFGRASLAWTKIPNCGLVGHSWWQMMRLYQESVLPKFLNF